jgi:hypothetical protein
MIGRTLRPEIAAGKCQLANSISIKMAPTRIVIALGQLPANDAPELLLADRNLERHRATPALADRSIVVTRTGRLGFSCAVKTW